MSAGMILNPMLFSSTLMFRLPQLLQNLQRLLNHLLGRLHRAGVQLVSPFGAHQVNRFLHRVDIGIGDVAVPSASGCPGSYRRSGAVESSTTPPTRTPLWGTAPRELANTIRKGEAG